MILGMFMSWSPVGELVSIVGSRKRITNNDCPFNPSATGPVATVLYSLVYTVWLTRSG